MLFRLRGILFGQSGKQEQIGVTFPADHFLVGHDLRLDDLAAQPSNLDKLVMPKRQWPLGLAKDDLDLAGFLDAEAVDRFHDLPGHVGMGFLQDLGGKIIVVVEPVDRCSPKLGQKVQGGIEKPSQETGGLSRRIP